MDFRQIKNLMKEFEDSKIHKLEINDKDFSIKLEKQEMNHNFSVSSPFVPVDSFAESISAKGKEQEKVAEVNHNTPVRSPLVGTYYQASSPDSEPFVKLNKTVHKGDVLFIVEAMKVMNEITSPVSGTIVKFNVKDGTMVEFDQVVLEIAE
ncbi:MAG: acetyl-CoA carboxylase biotin carboxyl carrier protein [Firmicutes bacterium]|nr:acetyl-CoA carboxylase biotin carboxyl carrier protein [Bacillota bacterium]